MKRKCGFTVGSDLTVKTWDVAAEDTCNKPSSSIVGGGIERFFPLLEEEIGLVFSDGKKRQIKGLRNACFLGSDLTADVYLTPLKGRSGKVKEISVTLENISGMCSLCKIFSESEQMISIGKVASTLAHGVRNPLNAIKGAVVYLTEKYAHEQTLQEFGKIMNDEIARLDKFISSFLSTSRGKTMLKAVSLNDIIRAIIIMIKPKAESQEVKVISNFSPLPSIMADPFQIEQVFFNIINNALEAMPEGGTLEVNTFQYNESGDAYIAAEISDTGKGVSKKDLARLGDLSEKSGRVDRGFGLFISREIIKSHNGKLFCESKRGKGTTFKIYLPVNQDG